LSFGILPPASAQLPLVSCVTSLLTASGWKCSILAVNCPDKIRVFELEKAVQVIIQCIKKTSSVIATSTLSRTCRPECIENAALCCDEFNRRALTGFRDVNSETRSLWFRQSFCAIGMPMTPAFMHKFVTGMMEWITTFQRRLFLAWAASPTLKSWK
jgi:hypothetical protein